MAAVGIRLREHEHVFRLDGLLNIRRAEVRGADLDAQDRCDDGIRRHNPGKRQGELADLCCHHFVTLFLVTLFSRFGRQPQIPVEGVKIARHMMFVDCARAQKELGFKPGAVSAALDRAVRWYEANGYVKARRARRIVHAAA